MLAIRLQRVGRKGYAQYRLVVQDAQRSPSSGRVVANIGNYNPHTKEIKVDKEAATNYLQNGAQPSPRVARLMQAEGVALPSWVKVEKQSKKRSVKNPEKLRKNQPAEPEAEASTEEAGAEDADASDTADATEKETTAAESPE